MWSRDIHDTRSGHARARALQAIAEELAGDEPLRALSSVRVARANESRELPGWGTEGVEFAV